MMFEKIVVKATSAEVVKLKELLKRLEESISDLIIGPLLLGELGHDFIVSFNVDDKHYRMIIEKLTMNKIKVLTLDDKIIEIINATPMNVNVETRLEEVKEKEQTKLSPFEVQDKVLDEAIQNGDYEKVIQIAMDIRNNGDIVERAKNNISYTLFIAIEKAYHKALEKKYEIPKSFTRLIEISADNKLKTLQFTELLKYAGARAVNLSALQKEHFRKLIQICNDSKLINYVNIKAAVKFSEIALKDQEQYRFEIDLAVRELNIKWLQIVFDIASVEFSAEEQNQFNELVDFIRAKRSAPGSTGS
ncbi:MAG: hypothetical protein IPM56_00820 [Ignavibacteriales bacterium]|nr:MAG: hypothetical protein IPM56_00820 [Ignavibacteriales bacterium]